MRSILILIMAYLLSACSASTFYPEASSAGQGSVLQNGVVETCGGPFKGVVEFARIGPTDLQEAHGFTPSGKASYEVDSGTRKVLLAFRCTPSSESTVFTAFAVVEFELKKGETYRIKEYHQGYIAELWVVDSSNKPVTERNRAELMAGWQGIDFKTPRTE